MPLLSTIGAAAARAFGFLRALVTGGYNVANSLRFNVGSSDYLEKALTGVDGNRQIWTFSCWVKRSVLGTVQTIFSFGENLSSEGNLFFDANDFLVLTSDFQNGGSNETDMKFRDVGAWYHIVWACDSTQAINADRWKVYVNGTQVTLTGSPTITLNGNGIINAWAAHDCWIGANARSQQSGNPPQYSGLYLSETYFIDGQQLTPSSFGETDPAIPSSGIWQPKAYTGTFGTNGFYLKFANSAALGTDSSGNGNNFTVNNLTSVDQSTDTCTNNFATWNSIIKTPSTFSNGNLSLASASGLGAYPGSMATIVPTKGKWYAEIKVTKDANLQIGFITAQTLIDGDRSLYAQSSNIYWQDNITEIRYYLNSVSQGNATVTGGTNSTSTYTTNDIIMLAMDLDSGYGWFGKNGTWQNSGNPASGTNAFNLASDYANGTTIFTGCLDANVAANFGSPSFTIASGNSDANGYGNFEYAVPSGFYALNTKNLAEYA